MLPKDRPGLRAGAASHHWDVAPDGALFLFHPDLVGNIHKVRVGRGFRSVEHSGHVLRFRPSFSVYAEPLVHDRRLSFDAAHLRIGRTGWAIPVRAAALHLRASSIAYPARDKPPVGNLPSMDELVDE